VEEYVFSKPYCKSNNFQESNPEYRPLFLWNPVLGKTRQAGDKKLAKKVIFGLNFRTIATLMQFGN